MKILLVDDEVIALRALKKRVDWMKYGFTEVYEARSVSAAKDILQQDKIDLIFCDIEMAGENGLELVGYVKKNYSDTRSVMLTCHAEFTYVQQAIRYGAEDYILKPIDYEKLDVVLQRISGELRNEDRQEKIGSLVQRTLDVRAEKGEGDPAAVDSNEQRVRAIREYIEEHIHEKITMKMLADHMHMNEQHLMRVFKKETGQSVVDYVTQRRVAIASRMLKETNYSINFIANCVGSENYSYFTKVFKKQTGYTPSEYRAKFGK